MQKASWALQRSSCDDAKQRVCTMGSCFASNPTVINASQTSTFKYKKTYIEQKHFYSLINSVQFQKWKNKSYKIGLLGTIYKKQDMSALVASHDARCTMGTSPQPLRSTLDGNQNIEKTYKIRTDDHYSYRDGLRDAAYAMRNPTCVTHPSTHDEIEDATSLSRSTDYDTMSTSQPKEDVLPLLDPFTNFQWVGKWAYRNCVTKYSVYDARWQDFTSSNVQELAQVPMLFGFPVVQRIEAASQRASRDGYFVTDATLRSTDVGNPTRRLAAMGRITPTNVATSIVQRRNQPRNQRKRQYSVTSCEATNALTPLRVIDFSNYPYNGVLKARRLPIYLAQGERCVAQVGFPIADAASQLVQLPNHDALHKLRWGTNASRKQHPNRCENVINASSWLLDGKRAKQPTHRRTHKSDCQVATLRSTDASSIHVHRSFDNNVPITASSQQRQNPTTSSWVPNHVDGCDAAYAMGSPTCVGTMGTNEHRHAHLKQKLRFPQCNHRIKASHTLLRIAQFGTSVRSRTSLSERTDWERGKATRDEIDGKEALIDISQPNVDGYSVTCENVINARAVRNNVLRTLRSNVQYVDYRRRKLPTCGATNVRRYEGIQSNDSCENVINGRVASVNVTMGTNVTSEATPKDVVQVMGKVRSKLRWGTNASSIIEASSVTTQQPTPKPSMFKLIRMKRATTFRIRFLFPFEIVNVLFGAYNYEYHAAKQLPSLQLPYCVTQCKHGDATILCKAHPNMPSWMLFKMRTHSDGWTLGTMGTLPRSVRSVGNPTRRRNKRASVLLRNEVQQIVGRLNAKQVYGNQRQTKLRSSLWEVASHQLGPPSRTQHRNRQCLATTRATRNLTHPPLQSIVEQRSSCNYRSLRTPPLLRSWFRRDVRRKKYSSHRVFDFNNKTKQNRRCNISPLATVRFQPNAVYYNVYAGFKALDETTVVFGKTRSNLSHLSESFHAYIRPVRDAASQDSGRLPGGSRIKTYTKINLTPVMPAVRRMNLKVESRGGCVMHSNSFGCSIATRARSESSIPQLANKVQHQQQVLTQSGEQRVIFEIFTNGTIQPETTFLFAQNHLKYLLKIYFRPSRPLVPRPNDAIVETP
jgi:hypothetical protein